MEESSSSPFELQLEAAAQTHLKDTTRWTRFLAITCIVLLGFMTFMMLAIFMFKDQFTKSFSEVPQLSGYGGGLLMAVVGSMLFVFIVIFCFFVFILLRFSSQTSKGIDQQNQFALENGISSLKNYMIMTGVFGMLSLLFVLLKLIIKS